MGTTTEISWTNIPGYIGGTWNPWQGCTKVSAGCANCYMYRDKKRYGQDPTKVIRSAQPTFNLPARTKEPHAWFVCSWSDFLHEGADEWRPYAFDIILDNPQHLYLILTKRPENAFGKLPVQWYTDWPSNVWLGVTAENQAMADERIPLLLDIPARVRFVSVEPMLGPVDIDPFWKNWVHSSPRVDTHISWIIAGGESGPNARPMQLEWARALREQCKDTGVPFFFKQIDGKIKHLDDFPEDLRVREFPAVPAPKQPRHASQGAERS